MAEKESEKVKVKGREKERTGKLLNSFVVLTIVLSVLAVSVAPVIAPVPPPPEPTSITVTAEPKSIPANGTVESNITARAMDDSTPSSGFTLTFGIIEGPDDAELIPDPDGGAYSDTEVWDIIDEDGYAFAQLKAGTEPGTVTVEVSFRKIHGGPCANTTVNLTSEYGVEFITGTVTEGDGLTPIEEAIINVTQDSTFINSTSTNETGKYLITELPAGSYNVTVSKSYLDRSSMNCALNTTSVEVEAGDATVLDIKLRHIADMYWDGSVNMFDLNILSAAWGTCEGDPDFNPIANLYSADDCINMFDLNIFAAEWGTTYYGGA